MRTKNEPGGRGTPTFIEAARRAQIIEAAIDTLVDVGYARTTMAEIASRANISKSVISYYFDSKDALLEKVVESIYLTGAATVAEHVLPTSSAMTALRTWIRTDVEFIGSHPREIRAIAEIAFGMRAPDGGPRWDATSGDWMVESVETLFRAGQKSGEFRQFSTRAMGVTLRAAIDRVSFELMTHPGMDIEEYANELITIFELATRNPERHSPAADGPSGAGPDAAAAHQPL
ncbi:MAG: TetR/AcrR family transcriptional regulator [Tepidiformaceae bacterium]